MILKQIGVCAVGSFLLDPVSMGETLETFGGKQNSGVLCGAISRLTTFSC